MKRIIIMLFILMIAGCASQPAENPSEDTSGDEFDDGLDDTSNPDSQPASSEEGVAAVVNGEEVHQTEVDMMREQLSMQGTRLNDSAVLQQVIAQKLLIQKAKAEGFEVTDEEAEKELSKVLEERGSSSEDLKSQIPEGQYNELLERQKEQMALMQLAQGLVNVTEEDVQKAYEESDLGNVSFEEAEPKIRDALEEKRRQEQLSALSEKLAAEAEIEYMN
ncbi:MAG: hypothetical protein ACOCQX_03220 [Candidatus Nanoarchaeia archaeon]